MHELAITEEVVRIVNDKAQKLGAPRVTSVEIIVGAISGVVSDSLVFYFEHLSKGTPSEGARLDFVRVAARARCRQCRHEFVPEEYDWTCPTCDYVGADLIAGKELSVATIEVE